MGASIAGLIQVVMDALIAPMGIISVVLEEEEM